MPAHELVLLSSSPPHVPDSDIISTPPGLYDSRTPWSLPESPDLLSPSKLLQRKPQGLKSGSRAAEIPPGVSLGFASAGLLVRERHLSLGEDEQALHDDGTSRVSDAAANPKKPTKRVRKQTKAGDNANELAKNPRKRKTKLDTDTGPLVLAQAAEDGSSTDKSVTQRVKADTRGTTASKDSAITAQERQNIAENPKKRKTKAPLNNSALINEIIGTKTLGPAAVGEVGEAGAVGKAKRLKSKANIDELANTSGPVEADELVPAVDKTVPNEQRASKSNPPKTAEKKPRGRKSNTVDVEFAEATGQVNTTGAPKPKSRRSAARDMVDTTSKHFSRDNSEDTAVPQNPVEGLPEEAVRPQPAIPRRLSWTPPRETNLSPTGRDPSRPIDVSETPTETVGPALTSSFSKLLDGFGYSKGPDPGNPPSSRAGSGEAFTKRRKLELVDKLDHLAKDTIAEPRPDKPEKAPKKKPRTITDLATAAYRPALPNEPIEAPPLDPNVSTFFAPRTASLAESEVLEVAGAENPKRTVRQKSPAKKVDSKPKKTNTKSKKAIKPAAEKLLSPKTALLRMNHQDVLFGTSSQLAREDSPTFVRNLQQAIRDSDAMGTEKDTTETLHLKPAVEGSGLSLIGRRRGLWTAAARDLEDGILEEEQWSKVDQELSVFVEDCTDFIPSTGAGAPSRIEDETLASFLVANDPSDDPTPAAERANADMGQLHQQTRATPVENDFESFPSAQPISPSSDYIDIDEFDRQHQLSQQQDFAVTSNSTRNLCSPPGLSQRGVLQPLAAHRNIPVLPSPGIDYTGIRLKSTLANKSKSQSKDVVSKPVKSPTKRPRGRPPAVSKPEGGRLALKPPRVRRRKESVSDSDTSQPLQDAVSDKDSIPLKRPPGRPRKDASSNPSLSPAKPTRSRKRKDGIAEQDHTVDSRTTTSPTTPIRRKSTHDEEWPHVDDIEDSEKEISPSPPRQKKVPDASPSLTLSPSKTDTAGRPVSSRTCKVIPHVPSESLDAAFCCITAVVKAAPPSADSMRPSWHEKMLLYDPIIVEDFAEWLNAKGVKVKVVVPVPRTSKKRTKKKKDAETDGALNDEEDSGTEMQQLPGWVVQRWCEENSICCIYKDSTWKVRKKRR